MSEHEIVRSRPQRAKHLDMAVAREEADGMIETASSDRDVLCSGATDDVLQRGGDGRDCMPLQGPSSWVITRSRRAAAGCSNA